MLSHELARLLLSRRNNDLKFEVGVDTDPTGLEEESYHLIEMVDDRDRIVYGKETPPEEVVAYHAENDYLCIRLGTVYLGDPEVYREGLCGNREDHGPHMVKEGSLAPYWCHADQPRREPHASEAAKLRSEKQAG